jgi:hypothetical protein
MIYRNKQTGKLYEITHEADKNGICQVYDKELNEVYLIHKDYIEPYDQRVEGLIRDAAEMREFYKVIQ